MGIEMAMPVPSNYKNGVILFERNDKYESLYEACVLSELPHYLIREDSLRFLYDALLWDGWCSPE